MTAWKIGALVAVATAGVAVALILAGRADGLAMLAYVLFLAAVAFAVVIARARALPAGARFEALLPRPRSHDDALEQLETMRRLLDAATADLGGVHFRLRPMVREIMASRLSPHHGVELEHDASRVEAIVGNGRLWGLGRPDRDPPSDRFARGWTRRELQALLDELEQL